MKLKNLIVRLLMSGVAVALLVYVRFYEGAKSVTSEELILLGLAFVPWLSEFVSSFKIGADGVEVITQRLDNVEKKAKAAFDASVHGIAKNPRSVSRRRSSKKAETSEAELVPVADDPNKGKFGGKSEVNSRRLSACVEKIPDEDYFRRVILRVESTDANKPLTGKVTFCLHPSFEPECYEEKVKKGVAQTTLVAYGAFTAGAKVDGGQTLLEFDLTTLDDGDAFFDR